MTIERRAQALLDIVEADRRERIATIFREAAESVAALLREAHREARARMRQAFAEERRLRNERVHAARANLQTRRRLTAQQREAALLAEAWLRLPGALLARWRATTTRCEWIAYVVARASSVLPAGNWHIDHPAEWPAGEREELVGRLARELGVAPALRSDASIRAGLRIAGAGTVVDGSIDGLLRDRAENDARLLAWLEVEELHE